MAHNPVIKECDQSLTRDTDMMIMSTAVVDETSRGNSTIVPLFSSLKNYQYHNV